MEIDNWMFVFFCSDHFMFLFCFFLIVILLLPLSASIPVAASIAHLYFIKMLPMFQLFYSDFSQCNKTVYGFTINYADLYALCQLSGIYGAFRTPEDFRTNHPEYLKWLSANVDYLFLRAQDTGRTKSSSHPLERPNRWACSFQHTAASANITKTYSFRCFYLLKCLESLIDWDKFCCFLFARNRLNAKQILIV